MTRYQQMIDGMSDAELVGELAALEAAASALRAGVHEDLEPDRAEFQARCCMGDADLVRQEMQRRRPN